MKECGRCGIELPSNVTNGSWCVDCVDVEETGHLSPQVREVAHERSYRVSSSRRGLVEDRDAVVEAVRVMTLRRMSANQIALAVGVSTRTVDRYRAESKVVVPLLSGPDYHRNPDAARTNNQGAVMASLQTGRLWA